MAHKLLLIHYLLNFINAIKSIFVRAFIQAEPLCNGLFGVLDSQYAQNMEDVICRIQSKELYKTHLFKNQTSILDSTINLMRTSNDEMERRIRHMETHVTDLENTIRTGNMAQVSSELTLTAGHIKRTQTAVINIVTRLKRGIVSPAVISVSQLRKEITRDTIRTRNGHKTSCVL